MTMRVVEYAHCNFLSFFSFVAASCCFKVLYNCLCAHMETFMHKCAHMETFMHNLFMGKRRQEIGACTRYRQ